MFCAYWELHKYLHVLVHIEGCTWFSNVGWFQGLRKYLHVLVLIQGCSWFSMCWPALGAWRVSARVITFREQGMQLHVSVWWKSWLLLRWMLCIWGFACSCGMYLCVPSAELVSLFVAMYWERGMYARCVCLHLPALSVYLHALRAWQFSACVSTYQELGVYYHV